MKGIIVAAFSVLAIVLGILCALKLSETLASFLLEKEYVSSGWAQLVSYALLFIGVVFIVRLTAKAIQTSVEAVMLGWVNKSLGGMLYAFIAVMAWSTILWLGVKMKLVNEEQIAASKTYNYVAPVSPWVAERVGVLWPMAKEVYADLEVYFDNVKESLPQHVDTTG